MAEEENGQEKTEEATPKRREKAREEGQVARSRELGTTLLLVIGALSILIFGGVLSDRLQLVMTRSFQFNYQTIRDPSYLYGLLEYSSGTALDALLLVLVALMLAGIAGSIALGGWLFSFKPMIPKLSRMNPISGLQRMFSLKALVELFKSLAKFLVVAVLASVILYAMQSELLSLGREDITAAMIHATQIVLWSGIGMAASTILIAAVDVPFQIFDNAKKLRMTHQQIKDEFKDSEGKPEVKSKVRQLQRELAQSRMMAAVPEADVVITNPEHFSVALKYDMEGQGAPVVVAKGADEIALKVREIARNSDVPIIRTPLLTRAIYFTTEIDEQIPGELYLAVAQLLAFIFQLNEAQRKRPIPEFQLEQLNRKLSVPESMQYDPNGNPGVQR